MDDKKDKKKGNKRNSKEFLNVVPFKTKSLKEQKIETEKEIWEKVDSFSKELVKAFKEKATKEALEAGDSESIKTAMEALTQASHKMAEMPDLCARTDFARMIYYCGWMNVIGRHNVVALKSY